VTPFEAYVLTMKTYLDSYRSSELKMDNLAIDARLCKPIILYQIAICYIFSHFLLPHESKEYCSCCYYDQNKSYYV